MLMEDSSPTVLAGIAHLYQFCQLKGSLQIGPETLSSRQECQRSNGSIFGKRLRICLDDELRTCLSLFSSSSWPKIGVVCTKA